MRTLIATIGLVVMAVPGVTSAVVNIDWVAVGDPGNTADTTGFGTVAYPYEIGKYEVTNDQYAEFLNAVAATDPYLLYNTRMGWWYGGITRSGLPGSYTYSTIAGREYMPVNSVSFFDCLRFANWLHNGQGSGDTETGAYTLLGGTPTPLNGATVTRNFDAFVFLTSEDEWYKAAYYDTGSASYFDYPASADASTTCASPGATANTANCNDAEADFTDAGDYTGSASPNGTFDQGGNIWEWNEAIIGSNRGLRGGAFNIDSWALAATNRNDVSPIVEGDNMGFRVARLDFSPGLPALNPVGIATLAVLMTSAGLVSLVVRHGRATRARPRSS